MPDDPLATVPAATSPPSVPPAADPPNPDNGASHVTPEQLQSAMAEALRPYEDQIRTLERQNRDLTERLQTPPAAPPNGEEPDFFSQFTNDPQKAIRDVFQGEWRQVAPLVANLHNTTHQTLLTRHQISEDAKYGEGTWKELYEPVLKEVFENTRQRAPDQLVNPDFVEGEVLKLRGFHEEKLQERRAKAREAAAEQEKAGMDRIRDHVANSTNLIGGIRAPKTGRELTAEEKEYVSLRSEHGRQLDEKALQRNLQFSGRGTSFEQWQAQQPKEKT